MFEYNTDIGTYYDIYYSKTNYGKIYHDINCGSMYNDIEIYFANH